MGRAEAVRQVDRHLEQRGDSRLLLTPRIGYLPISRTGAMLFFQLMSRRYEHGSPWSRPTNPSKEYGEIFGDEVMAAALIDRLLHHCHIVNIRGNSYSVRNHSHLWKQPDSEKDDAPRRRRQHSSRLEEVAMD